MLRPNCNATWGWATTILLAHLALDGAAAAEGNLLKAVGAFEQLAAVEPGDLDNRRRLRFAVA